MKEITNYNDGIKQLSFNEWMKYIHNYVFETAYSKPKSINK